MSAVPPPAGLAAGRPPTGAPAATHLARLRALLAHWLNARRPRSDSWTLDQRNLFILPTRAGWGFCITLVVMLLAAINYQLNLGYALTFLLGGAALVSMHQTHGNLRRLTLRLRAGAPVFTGAVATLEVVLDNPARRDRLAVGLGLHSARRQGMAFVDVPAQGSTVAQLRWVPPGRGQHPVPALLVETHFPLGLFRAWSVWRPSAEQLVYPAPEQPTPALPAGQAAGAAEAGARRGGGGEFDGVRAWRRGDSRRQVVWKKLARTGELVSRDLGASAPQHLVLDWHSTATRDVEHGLSRLTAWVLAAEQRGQPYSLALPGQPLGPALGDGHCRAALRALALWPGTPAPEHQAAP